MTTRSEYFRAYRKEKGATIARQRKARKAAAKPPRLILGIDGEGYSLANGEHRYSYMAANSADGSYVSELASPRGRGLTHEEVFEWLLELPSHAILVGFALGYDRSKWFETLPEPVIYALVHPETRRFAERPDHLLLVSPRRDVQVGCLSPHAMNAVGVGRDRLFRLLAPE
jgi:hypothetical protein